jgi:tetratricopeptide (TPR) repeat protein
MRRRLLSLALFALVALPAFSQAITTPPSGNNQKSSVTQYLGLVRVTIDYSSPRVHFPVSNDRRGKVWGKLVPFGLAKNSGYGTCTDCPWRAGANENTVFTVSHDVKVEGQPLPAGSYGLFLIPEENADWTLIFSKDNANWGHFFYDASHDALRVKVKPEKSEYQEWLTYDFPVRELDKAKVALRWEDLSIPFTVSVDNIHQLYFDQMRAELRNAPGFDWRSYTDAAKYALQQKLDPKAALDVAKIGVAAPFPGAINFTTLSTLADAQAANGMTAEAKATREKAVNDPSASVIDLHGYGRSLLAQGDKEGALAVWELNAKKHPKEWPVNVGLARGYSAVGRYQDALKYAKLALAQAPDPANKAALEAGVARLESGKDMNQ